MAETSFGTMVMRRGKEQGALKLVNALRREAERSQKGTVVYLVHRKLDAKGQPTRELAFYERYSSMKALQAHLASKSWQAMVTHWPEFFEGKGPKDGGPFIKLVRIGAFMRKGAIPVKGTAKKAAKKSAKKTAR